MPNKGKRYTRLRAMVNPEVKYSLQDATTLLHAMKSARFDETVEVAVRLGVEPKYADQMVRGAVSLPHGTGSTVRVAVFAKGEKVAEAQAAGADFVGGDDLVEKVKDGWLEFDKAVATPDMMGAVGRIGRILGPRGLMPNPKVGTVTFDVGTAVREIKAGKVEFRVEKAGIVHARIGKASFPAEHLQENITTLVETLVRLKPAAAKGTYLKGITVALTMSPGVRVEVNEFQKVAR